MTDEATFPEDEVQAAVARYVEVRERIDRGEVGWAEFVDLFTDDAVFVDPAWGRAEGRDAIAHLFTTAMVGVDFTFPIDVTAIAGNWVFVRWRHVLPGARPDGRPWQQSGVSTLIYAGGGRFRYEEDHINLPHVMEDIAASGWQPGPGFTPPPEAPDRNFDPDPAPKAEAGVPRDPRG